MKIILLRHEERGIDVGFFSNLTENGIIQSFFHLPNKLKKLKIDLIFSSPFIRTLQTIYPYCYKYKKNVNIEYGLYEYLHNPYFLLFPCYYTPDNIEDTNLKSIININYKTIVEKKDFKILEDEENLEFRIKKFISYLFKEHPNKTILVVSHKGVINKIKDIYFKKTDLSDNFEMGSFEIYDLINIPK